MPATLTKSVPALPKLADCVKTWRLEAKAGEVFASFACTIELKLRMEGSFSIAVTH